MRIFTPGPQIPVRPVLYHQVNITRSLQEGNNLVESACKLFFAEQRNEEFLPNFDVFEGNEFQEGSHSENHKISAIIEENDRNVNIAKKTKCVNPLLKRAPSKVLVPKEQPK